MHHLQTQILSCQNDVKYASASQTVTDANRKRTAYPTFKIFNIFILRLEVLSYFDIIFDICFNWNNDSFGVFYTLD